MQATFQNRLRHVTEEDTGKRKVEFIHSYRCPVEAWFEETHNNPFGWVLQFKSKNKAVLQEFKSAIFKEGMHYLQKRTERPITELSYRDIQDMSQAVNILSFSAGKTS